MSEVIDNLSDAETEFMNLGLNGYAADIRAGINEIENLQIALDDEWLNWSEKLALIEHQRDAALKVLNEWILDMQIRSASLSEYAETFEEAVHLKGLCEKYRAEADQIRAMK